MQQEEDALVVLLPNRIRSLQATLQQHCKVVQITIATLQQALLCNRETQLKWLNRQFRKRPNYIPMKRSHAYFYRKRAAERFSVMSLNPNEFYNRIGMDKVQFFAIAAGIQNLLVISLLILLVSTSFFQAYSTRGTTQAKNISHQCSRVHCATLVALLPTCACSWCDV